MRDEVIEGSKDLKGRGELLRKRNEPCSVKLKIPSCRKTPENTDIRIFFRARTYLLVNILFYIILLSE